MAGARDHTELVVYRMCNEVRVRVRTLIERPAFSKAPKLRAQLEESSERPCAHIAEGFSRYYPREFAQFLRTAKASESETIVHLQRSAYKGLATQTEVDEITSLARRARGALTQFVLYLETAEPPPGRRRRHPETGPPDDAPGDLGRA